MQLMQMRLEELCVNTVQACCAISGNAMQCYTSLYDLAQLIAQRSAEQSMVTTPKSMLPGLDKQEVCYGSL